MLCSVARGSEAQFTAVLCGLLAAFGGGPGAHLLQVCAPRAAPLRLHWACGWGGPAAGGFSPTLLIHSPQPKTRPASLCPQRRGMALVRHFCDVLGAERVFTALSELLASEADAGDAAFALSLVQALNLCLLTSGGSLAGLRRVLRTREPRLFSALWRSWAVSAAAALSLALVRCLCVLARVCAWLACTKALLCPPPSRAR